MKILYIIDTLNGYGAEKSLVSIACNFKKTSVIFIHIYRGDKLKYLLENNGIEFYSLNIDLATGFRHAKKKIIPIIENEKPDIIHSTLFRADMVARSLKKEFPDILLVGSFVSNSYSVRRYRNLSLLSKFKLYTTQVRDRRSINQVDHFVSNSNAIKKTNCRALGISEEKVEIIYRGRSFEQSDFNNETCSLRKSFGIGDQKIFLNVGRLQKSKGQMDLIHAFKKLLNSHPNSFLLIVGEGSLRNELVQQIGDLHLEKNVLLLGYRDDVSHLLSIADFFVFPTFFEGLSGSLIEAVISRTACIVSNILENRECLPKNGALYFPPGDIHKMTTQMQVAIDMDDWPERIEMSYRYAYERFDIQKISRKYEDFYIKLLEKAKEDQD